MPGTKRETGTGPARAPKSSPPKSLTTKSSKAAAGKPAAAVAKAKGSAASKSAAPSPKPAPAPKNAPAAKSGRGATAPAAKPAARAPSRATAVPKSRPAMPAARPPAKSTTPRPAGPTAKKPVQAASGGSKAAATRSSIDVAFALSKLHQVALLATDLDRSIAFYRDVLGLAYMDRYDPPGLAFFHLGGGTRLILSATSSKATLYFKVDDIDSAVSALAARGVFFLHKPSMIHRDDQGRLGKKGVEEWMAFFKDPSDNILALVAQRTA